VDKGFADSNGTLHRPARESGLEVALRSVSPAFNKSPIWRSPWRCGPRWAERFVPSFAREWSRHSTALVAGHWPAAAP